MDPHSALVAGQAFMDAAQGIFNRIRDTQMENIQRAALLCASSIAQDGLVHLFGSGHSRIPVEEMFPRHGSFPGFHALIELSLTNHTQVVGANGQRQAMFIERIEGLGEIILQNFVFHPHDCAIIFSHSGVNASVMDVALGFKKRGVPLIAVVGLEHCQASKVAHSSGKKLPEVADIVIDNCTPVGDAMVSIEGLEYPVGPGSTIAYGLIVNSLKCMIAAELTRLGKPPLVLTSSALIGSQASRELFDRTYDEHRRRVAQVFIEKQDGA
jgi:uncharacterized phosphosugar-binding protein